MTGGPVDFAQATAVFCRLLVAYKTRRPQTNLVKWTWVLVHETASEFEQIVKSGPLATGDGFVLARGGRRQRWADRFPTDGDAIVCVISIGDDRRAFPVHVEWIDKSEVEAALEAIFEGAPDEECPTTLREMRAVRSEEG